MFSTSEFELPLQLYQLHDDNVRCYRAEPAASLATYIYYYWWLEVYPGQTTLDVIPDNAIDLVMSPDIPDFSTLYLPSSESFSIPLSGPNTYVGISFRAESAASFFGLPQASITNCTPGAPVTQNLAISTLVAGVQAIAKPEQLASSLDALATARLSSQPAVTSPTASLNVDKALAAMQASIGRNGMQSVAARFELSDRQFRRIMGSLFGYGPKKVQRVMRLQASLREIFSVDTLALEDGFHDEAHRIKELRALTGLTPGQIRKMSEIYNSME